MKFVLMAVAVLFWQAISLTAEDQKSKEEIISSDWNEPADKSAEKTEAKESATPAEESISKKGDEVIKAAERELDQKKVGKRIAALEKLRMYPFAQAVPVLSQALEDKADEVRALAVELLSAIPGEAAQETLSNAINDGSWPIRASIVLALGQRGPSAIPALSRVIHDKDPRVRIAVVNSLGAVGSTRAVPVLVSALSDKEDLVVLAAIRALGAYRSGDAVPALSQLLIDRKDTRVLVAEALGSIGDVRALPVMSRIYTESSDELQIALAKALAQLTESSVKNQQTKDKSASETDQEDSLRRMKDKHEAEIKALNEKLTAEETRRKIAELYGAGVLAYYRGNASEALNYWNQVLYIDPNHEATLESIRRAQEDKPVEAKPVKKPAKSKAKARK